MVLLNMPLLPQRELPVASLPVAIIGAGPVGLAAAANLVERGIEFVMFEAGEHVADSMRLWGHIRLFSPWREVIDPAARRLLEATGWVPPSAEFLPRAKDFIEEYLVPLSQREAIAPLIRTGVEVVGVAREGMDRTRTVSREKTPFLLRLRSGHGVSETTARAVIDTSGTYRSPNSLASSGLEPVGLPEVADLVSHALPDVLGKERARFAGRHTTVVGAGHSAANTLLNLATLAEQEPGTRITWMIRNASAVRVTTSADDELAARATIGARVDELVASGMIELVNRFEIIRLSRRGDAVRIVGSRAGALAEHDTDLVVNATGFRPNLDMLREVRLELDDVVEAPKRLAPLIDPNIHTCGTVEPHGFAELQHPDSGFFLAGMKSYGRAPTFLLATGYEQVRSITAWLAGDIPAALDVKLTLPATGVCSTATTAGEAVGCAS